jgi:hypothetical protein
MYTPVLLTAFALFGAVVNTPTSPTEPSDMSPGITPPTLNAPLQEPPRTGTPAESGPSRMTPLQQRNLQRLRQLTSMSSGQNAGGNNLPILPQPPTVHSANAQSQIYQWLPPTVNPLSNSVGNRSTMTPGTQGGISLIPAAPTQARPDLPQSYASRLAAQSQARRAEALRDATGSTSAPVARPFANYQNPYSGTSPYMNLYRGGTNGVVDNYTTLVRPALQQQQTNQAVSNDIYSLQSSSHVQGLSLRRLGQETNNLQGVNATQYFMNYGDYYPGAR